MIRRLTFWPALAAVVLVSIVAAQLVLIAAWVEVAREYRA